jgi:hypothetical protein
MILKDWYLAVNLLGLCRFVMGLGFSILRLCNLIGGTCRDGGRETLLIDDLRS